MRVRKRMGTVLAAVLALVLVAQGAIACERPTGAGKLEAAVLAWANAEREARGLPAFRMDSRLHAAALAHACDMAERDYFAHARPGGPKLAARIKAAGYTLHGGAENIAYTVQAEAASATGVWRKSAPHWRTLISNAYADVGIAVAQGEGKVYWVMDFGNE